MFLPPNTPVADEDEAASFVKPPLEFLCRNGLNNAQWECSCRQRLLRRGLDGFGVDFDFDFVTHEQAARL
jgi:hypothetical protein